jgi:hypothetical protein
VVKDHQRSNHSAHYLWDLAVIKTWDTQGEAKHCNIQVTISCNNKYDGAHTLNVALAM